MSTIVDVNQNEFYPASLLITAQPLQFLQKNLNCENLNNIAAKICLI